MVWSVSEPKRENEKEEYYNYEQALAIIEQFMKETGIRGYCSEYCKGYCCGTCYKSKDACHKHEGRRMACSIYVCDSLEAIIFSKTEAQTLYRMRSDIDDALHPFYKASHYFDTPKNEKELRENFRVRKEIIDRLKKFDMDEIQDKVHFLRYLGSYIEGAVKNENKGSRR